MGLMQFNWGRAAKPTLLSPLGFARSRGGGSAMKRTYVQSSNSRLPIAPTPTRRLGMIFLWAQLVALLAVLVLTQSGVVDSSWVPAWRGPGDAGHLDRLAMAVETRNLEALQQLLTAHPNRLDTMDIDGLNSLLRAASIGWTDGCRVLLDHGAKMSVTDSRGTTPLCYAVMARGPQAGQVIQLLLDHGANPDGKDCGSQVPLVQAAFAGRPDVAAILLRGGASIDRKGMNQWTALHWAAMH